MTVGLLLILSGIWAYLKINKFFRVNNCLEKGGRWNYETEQCEFAKQENRRPQKTIISNPTVDTTHLFKIWTLDPNGPHADFWIKPTQFYIVDYDGDGSMPYILNQDSLTIFYDDYIQRGKIVSVTKDTLKIQWEGSESLTQYVEWRN